MAIAIVLKQGLVRGMAMTFLKNKMSIPSNQTSLVGMEKMMMMILILKL